MSEKDAPLTIGALADAAGVNVETVRFYQRRGLMSEPARPHGSIRRYTGAELARVRFIKAAQRLGFSLDEVCELLELEDGTQCRVARGLAERKLVDVRRKLADLRRIETVLGQLVTRCKSARGALKCPLISSLQQS
ncbi:MAG: Hg(II)-responsive transcriptional regulator [Betaproteobacteria bacterium]|jgi:MerR family mercuric resistance operon transcriptional regulator|nr:Hg(II)-responsive transcriptional regulator [Betaproteobacteria bacterium]